MAKYRVFGNVVVGVWIDVEADSQNEAMEKADENWEGLTGFCGNGGTDKLIGVYSEDHGIFANEDCPAWVDAESY